jgi:hypothetical protein
MPRLNIICLIYEIILPRMNPKMRPIKMPSFTEINESFITYAGDVVNE